jgi:hypothetical protein
MQRTMRIIRPVALVAITIFVALFGFVQIQQHLVRYRAEHLHAEILALQHKPGTFADIQRLQHEWGAFAQYKGECTQHHCIYDIVLQDLIFSIQPIMRTEPYAPRWLVRLAVRNDCRFGECYDVIAPWFIRTYRILGGRPAYAHTNVRVRDNRMWGADFGLAVWAYPGTGRNDGQPYVVLAGVSSGSRLLSWRPDLGPEVLRQGYRTFHELNCLGCELATAAITPQTPSKEIDRLNQFNFACITRIDTCRHPFDLAPFLWESASHDTASSSDSDHYDPAFCQVPTSTLAREANDVLLVEVLSTYPFPPPSTYPFPPPSTVDRATVKVLRTLKNGRNTPPGKILDFANTPMAVRPTSGNTSSLSKGQQYYFLYNHPKPNSVFNWVGLRSCHGILNTPANAAEVETGIALDPSNGEPYDYLNEP